MKFDRENDRVICDARGLLEPTIVIGYGRHMCGNIIDGVSLAIGEGAAGFVLSFSDLEQAYLEAKNFRDRHPMTDEEKRFADMLKGEITWQSTGKRRSSKRFSGSNWGTIRT